MTADTDHAMPISTVDAVVLTIDEDELKVLLHKRPKEPFAGDWALPGGWIFADVDKDAEAAMRRVLKDKAGASGFYLEQLSTFTGPSRDPRGWSISIAHVALVPRDKLKISDDDNVKLVSVDKLPKLAFDHKKIINAAVARLRGKGAYSTLPTSFLAKKFTLMDMMKAYEIVLGSKLEQSSFRRKVLALDILNETDETSQAGNLRPARLYTLKDSISTFDRTLG